MDNYESSQASRCLTILVAAMSKAGASDHAWNTICCLEVARQGILFVIADAPIWSTDQLFDISSNSPPEWRIPLSNEPLRRNTAFFSEPDFSGKSVVTNKKQSSPLSFQRREQVVSEEFRLDNVSLLKRVHGSYDSSLPLLFFVLSQDNPILPRLYLTGVFFFVMMYTGSNVLPIGRYS